MEPARPRRFLPPWGAPRAQILAAGSGYVDEGDHLSMPGADGRMLALYFDRGARLHDAVVTFPARSPTLGFPGADFEDQAASFTALGGPAKYAVEPTEQNPRFVRAWRLIDADVVVTSTLENGEVLLRIYYEDREDPQSILNTVRWAQRR